MIVAFSKLEDAKKIKNVLNRNGYNDILACNSASQVIAAANENDGGIVLCGYRLPDMHYSELYGYLPREYQMLLVASPARLQECTSGDIMCLPMPFHTRELVSTIETMMLDLTCQQRNAAQRSAIQRNAMQRNAVQRRKKAKPVKRTEKEQQIIEDAKQLLMERNHLSEEEAHKYIQKLSMDSGNSMVETAGMILILD